MPLRACWCSALPVTHGDVWLPSLDARSCRRADTRSCNSARCVPRHEQKRGSFARATASARPVTWSLAKTFETWLRTVFSDMTRRRVRGRRGPAGRRPRTTVRTSSTVDLRRPHGGRLERWSLRAVMTAMTLVSVGGAGVLLDVGPQRTAHRTLLPRVESRPQLGWRTASPRRLKTRDTGQW